MVFVGPSGCGKSTLLRMIAGLEEISGGDLSFDAVRVNDMVPSARDISMVFQSYALYPHMTVFENMAFGLKLAKASKSSVREKVTSAAQMLQMEHLLDRLPKELSGGQRQRVAIGRAIVRNPKVFLFDEPLSNLDAALRAATRLEIAKLHDQLNGVTMIYVTHDQVEAMTLADRICVLKDGRVEQVGTPSELYDAPSSVFVAGFIGSPQMNLLQGEVAKKHKCETLGIRAEHIEMSPPDPIWNGTISYVEDLGADRYLFVDIGQDNPLVVRHSNGTVPAIGASIGLSPMPSQLHRFDALDQRIAE